IIFLLGPYADGECFQDPVSSFPSLYFEKIKASAFDGPQVRAVASDREFVRNIN
ncbi:hypothetical protein AVEN_237580-1, partial [Araneus ventricosus]